MMELTETEANTSLSNDAAETATLDHQDQDTNEEAIVTAVASSQVIDRSTIEQTSLPEPGPYRGFSTSICNLFNDPQDCCAFFCCGAFISDRTYYLFHEGRERRPPFYKRVIRHFLVPLIIFVFAALSYAIPDVNVAFALGKTFTFLFIIYVAVDLVMIRQSRARFRVALLGRLRGDTVTAEGVHHQNVTQWLQDKYHSSRAHKICCGCYEDDGYRDSYQPLEGEAEAESQQQQVDFCTGWWRCLASMCCGNCCGCWCQCCGICAMAQEAREIKRIVPNESRMIDFITFEPYADYFSKILALRSSQTSGFFQHFKTLSKLSRLLLTWLGVFFSLMLVLAMIPVDKSFTMKNMVVFIATFFQAIFILYFVHWKYNRFELSLDAVVKYFASGFLFSVSVAMVSEVIVQVILNIALLPIAIAEKEPMDESSEEYSDDNASSGTDQQEIYKQWAQSHPFFILFNYFLMSFCVAALVEELCKYFGYLIVEHPDFTSLSENHEPIRALQNGEGNQTSNSSNGVNKVAENFSIGDDEEAEDPDLEGENSLDGTNRNSVRARIMVAMVSVAVGFACCENLMYVFSAGSFVDELVVLFLRSILPVHPLAAAIQSIGVCYRDLEGDKQHQIGRIIFPAIILHGSFDFFVFAMSLLALVTTDSSADDTEEKMDMMFVLYVCLGCLFIMGLGVSYYVKKSNSLKARLKEMDRESAAVRSSLL